ncbi:hypothetical protein, partial [Mycolicibacterium fortuitum]|uniref:hypothetical protein n=1 Tax=Mycolicibacterium fortuitum TaxID=1766 RepID=UPI001A95FD4A
VRAGIAAGVSFCRAFTVGTRDVDLLDEQFPDDTTSSAVGLRHSHTPGEVSDEPLESPSPGAFPFGLSEELLRGHVIAYAALAGIDLAEAADSLRHVAELIDPRGPVREDDLSAHITAIRNAWRERWQGGETNALTLSDEIARDLVSDYRITKK